MASKAATAGAGGVAARWHESLPIQINWTYEVDYCTARIFCPGNVHRWEMAVIHGPDPEQTKAYARLIAAAPELLAALCGVVAVADRETDEFIRARAAIAAAKAEPANV